MLRRLMRWLRGEQAAMIRIRTLESGMQLIEWHPSVASAEEVRLMVAELIEGKTPKEMTPRSRELSGRTLVETPASRN